MSSRPVASTPTSCRLALAADVIRYWQALLSHEEALAARPRARRPQNALLGPSSTAVNLEEPQSGQDYAKLPFAGAEAFLVDRTGEVRAELTPEWAAFLENWLAARYRRGDDDESSISHLVSFPTLHLPRDELAGVLRFPVELVWKVGGEVFRSPDYGQRKRSLWPPPPTHAVLKCSVEPSDSALPFFIDTRVLHETLRIDSERIDDFFAELRTTKRLTPRTTIAALCQLIEGQEACEAANQPVPATNSALSDGALKGPAAVLSRLCTVVSSRLARLASRTRAYGVAIVISTDRSRATWHLQRDLKSVLEQIESSGLDKAVPLSAYLGGQRQVCKRSTCWGRWPGARLTTSQLEAGEIALGSTLAAVQGPPGTGKTTLILNLLAHALVGKVTALSRSERMGRSVTVVTSTNNRAVDNVVDPLGRDFGQGRLPLSLRVGSRQVLEKITLVDLMGVRRWLDAVDIADGAAKESLAEELARFRALRSEIETLVEPERAYRALVEREQAVLSDLTDLRAERVAAATPEPIQKAISRIVEQRTSAVVLVALNALEKRLTALSALSEGEGQASLAQVKKHWKRTKQKQVPAVVQGLGFEVALPLPPSPEPSSAASALEAWEEGAENALDIVRNLRLALNGESQRREIDVKIAKLEKELESLRVATSTVPSKRGPEGDALLDQRHRELFECAVRVREAWARVHRVNLLAAVDAATKAIQAARSLRALMEAEREPSRWLRELFPAWGCTLLSLGNVFPSESGCVEMVIVDEAGQCHPAYGLGALLRGRSALVIGDVHQLEPVVGLTLDDERRVVQGLGLATGVDALAPYRAYDGSGTSAQALADRSVETRATLVDHFRCQAPIIAICEALCGYGLVAHTPDRTRADMAPRLIAPVLHVPASGRQERFAGSWWNEVEARVTLELVRELLDAGIRPAEIGIVTPYRGQLERLFRGLREARIPLERPSSDLTGSDDLPLFGAADTGMAVGTVHRFQGGERSIILFSTTATTVRSLAFLDARVNLVNVAASRAREHLITIGHTATLASGQCTRYLVERAVSIGP